MYQDDRMCVVVLSCDSYTDILPIYFKLKKKYWKQCPFEVYVLTERMELKYAKTLRKEYPVQEWTRRLREGLGELGSKYVLVMDGDMFLRGKVDEERIYKCLEWFRDDIACFSFESEYAPTIGCEFEGFREKPNKSEYLNSCQPSIWDREKLIERLQEDKNPWEWELTEVDTPYKHYVNVGEEIMQYGYPRTGIKFGICRGKWVKEDVVPLFEKEGIEVDFEIRGFYIEKEKE